MSAFDMTESNLESARTFLLPRWYRLVVSASPPGVAPREGLMFFEIFAPSIGGSCGFSDTGHETVGRESIIAFGWTESLYTPKFAIIARAASEKWEKARQEYMKTVFEGEVPTRDPFLGAPDIERS